MIVILWFRNAPYERFALIPDWQAPQILGNSGPFRASRRFRMVFSSVATSGSLGGPSASAFSDLEVAFAVLVSAWAVATPSEHRLPEVREPAAKQETGKTLEEEHETSTDKPPSSSVSALGLRL